MENKFILNAIQMHSQHLEFVRVGNSTCHKVRNEALEDFDWLSLWQEWKLLTETG